jgi:hypothetical protein
VGRYDTKDWVRWAARVNPSLCVADANPPTFELPKTFVDQDFGLWCLHKIPLG